MEDTGRAPRRHTVVSKLGRETPQRNGDSLDKASVIHPKLLMSFFFYFSHARSREWPGMVDRATSHFLSRHNSYWTAECCNVIEHTVIEHMSSSHILDRIILESRTNLWMYYAYPVQNSPSTNKANLALQMPSFPLVENNQNPATYQKRF